MLPTVTRMATASAISRQVPMSSSILGSSTMMDAPSRAPVRLLRPPMMMASRNRMVSSKLYVLGEMYCSEYEYSAPARPAKPALITKANTLCR
ncbi:hypothetical protein G6F46_015710 [Rhizopus delemar]|nr:hypothetical protein G6F46_015710 [Rhizopus delemar]